MKWVIILALVGGVFGYVRLAPTDIERWLIKLPAMGPGEYPGVGRYLEVRTVKGDGSSELAALKEIALTTPRTKILHTAADNREMVFVSRSRWIGFPDYTTIQLLPIGDGQETSLRILGRLRFGKHDLGVNQSRIRSWLSKMNEPAPVD